MLRGTVEAFAADEIAPRAAAIDRDNDVPDGPLAQVRRPRRARHHGRGGIRRRRHGLSGARRRDGGDLARLRLGRPVLWRAFQSLRQPDPPQRQRGAEAALPAEADLRRACRRARDERAGRRLRCRRDAHARGEARRSLRAERHEDVDHQRAGCRCAGGLCQDRPEGGAAGHHGVPDREGLCRDSPRRRSSTSSACAAPTPASWCSTIAKCRRTTCWDASTTACAC